MLVIIHYIIELIIVCDASFINVESFFKLKQTCQFLFGLLSSFYLVTMKCLNLFWSDR